MTTSTKVATATNMATRSTSIKLSWIVVRDLQKAIAFYTEVVGLKLLNSSPEYGWAELCGTEEGSSLGLATSASENQVLPGGNAVVTVTVPNIENAKKAMSAKGTRFLGDVLIVPGHVKLQTFQDQDGNTFQLVEDLSGHK